MDIYFEPRQAGEGKVVEKMSRFLSLAIRVSDSEQAKEAIKDYRNRYHDARHVCWAYMIGPERTEWQLNDNGEPSGTAGKPILGQINSRNLTNVLVMVARYFGGIKLGTPGLTAAYKAAAAEALEAAGIKECFQKQTFLVTFPYVSADGVMKLIKSEELEVTERVFDNICSLKVSVRLDRVPEIESRLSGIDGVCVETTDF